MSRVHVVDTSARQVIPGRWWRENGWEIEKMRNLRKAGKTFVFFIVKYAHLGRPSVSCRFCFLMLSSPSFGFFFYVFIVFFEGSFSFMTNFLPGMGWIFFFSRLAYGQKVTRRMSLFWFQSLSTQPWTRLILLWILKVRSQFQNDKTRIIARSCDIWAKSLCWFGGSALSTSWNVTTAASMPQINNTIGGNRENNLAARAAL